MSAIPTTQTTTTTTPCWLSLYRNDGRFVSISRCESIEEAEEFGEFWKLVPLGGAFTITPEGPRLEGGFFIKEDDDVKELECADCGEKIRFAVRALAPEVEEKERRKHLKRCGREVFERICFWMPIAYLTGAVVLVILGKLGVI